MQPLPQSTPKVKQHAGELDLLRFCAALLVLLFHFAFRGAAADGLSPLSYAPLSGMAKYGYLGVQLFFMISGFVITLSAQAGSVSSFIVARAARLYPAFWVCCSITFAVILLSGTHIVPASLGTWGMNMTMVPRLFMADFIDGSYWTLLVEVKFYCLIALIIAIGQYHRTEWFMYGWLAISVVNAIFPLPVLAGKLILMFAPCFIAGALFYFIYREGSTKLRWLGVAACWILTLKRGVEIVHEQTAHYGVPHSITIISLEFSAFFLIFGAIALHKTGKLGQMRWPLLGALTYPLYLLHQTIGYIMIGAWYGKVNDHVLFWGTIVLALAGAYLVAVFIEPPLMRAMRDGLTRLVNLTKNSLVLARR